MPAEAKQVKRPFNVKDVYNIKGVSSPRVSPDGSAVLCVITTADEEENNRKDHIGIVSLANNALKLLTEGSSPLWSPDGSEVAFEYGEDGKDGIWIYSLKEGSKRFLAPLYYSNYFINHLEAKNFAWSPDGNYIAYVSTEAQTESAEPEEVKVINRLLFKTKGGRGRGYFADGYLTHIWIIPSSGGQPQLLTPGHHNEHSLSWSPDSSKIAFISNRSADPDDNQYDDVWTVDTKSKKIKRLTDDLGTAFQPSWSPDGKHIAYLATTSVVNTNDSPAEDSHLYVIPSDGGSFRCLTKNLDRRVENLTWQPDGTCLYFTAGNHGRTPLLSVSIETAEIETVLDGDFHLLEYSINNSGDTISYTRTDVNHPAELFLFRRKSKEQLQITNENAQLLDECSLQDAESFWYNSFDGIRVQGWLMKPNGFIPTEKYPLVLVIHGGPHNMFGFDFEERMQVFAGNGYGVVFINPRGSSGYGQTFSFGCVLNWGGGDYKDVMEGMEQVISKNKWVDKQRLFVTGQSYGGYLTNWIITQTELFKAAIVDGGISNLISFAGTSLYHSLMESEFNGRAFDNFPLLWQWSPLRNVKNVRTPTLFLHGQVDNEVPVTQAEEMYIALKKLGVKTSFVQYLGEGHGWRPDLKPANRVDMYNRMIDWFNTAGEIK